MPAPARTPRDRWIEVGLQALASGGPDAVRVEALAQQIGVTKGGFYWHFDDRPTLLAEMLDSWEQTMVDQVIERVEQEDGDGRVKLRELFKLAFAVGDFLDVELAIRDWARRDRAVAARLRRVDDRRMAYLRELFGDFCTDDADVEARCLMAFSLFVGHHFIGADHGTRSRGDVLRLALEQQLR